MFIPPRMRLIADTKPPIMIPYTKSLLSELDMELREISVKSDSVLTEARLSYLAARKALLNLMEFISTYKFADQEEEHHYLKNIKPKFLNQLIYFEELLYLETKKPVGCRKRVRNFFQINSKQDYSVFSSVIRTSIIITAQVRRSSTDRC